MKASRRQFVQGLSLAAPAVLTAHVAAGQGASEESTSPGPKAIVILVRHTEKSTDDRVNPSLSEAGVVRAKALARLVGSMGVTGLLHTEYKRTRDTLAPLAEALGLKGEEIGASEMPKLIERIRGAKTGEVIAVAGHSNTIPAIAYALGVTLPGLDPIAKGSRAGHGNLPHGAYDRVHILTPGQTAANLVELRYGEPSA